MRSMPPAVAGSVLLTLHTFHGVSAECVSESPFSLSSLTESQGVRITGYELYPLTVCSLGDFNGDGVDDVAVGNGTQSSYGVAVAFGGTGMGVNGVVLAEQLTGENGFVTSAFNYPHGWALDQVSSAGDVNGDGYADLLIGAGGADLEEDFFEDYDFGVAYVIFGGPGVGGTGLLQISGFNGSSFNGTNGFLIRGVQGHDYLGGAVSCAGDVNNDGIDDIVIGASGYLDPGYTGEAYVLFGHTGSFPSAITRSYFNGTNGFILKGCGDAVSRGGDVNGDGVDDLLVGGGTARAAVVFGRDVGTQSAFPASLSVPSLNGTAGFRVVDDVNDQFSTYGFGRALACAGDVNDDGNVDFVIGSSTADPAGRESAGACYVLFGHAGIGASGVVNLSALDGTNGFSVWGAAAGDACGYSVSSVGDYDGDGISDIMVGSLAANPSGIEGAGRSAVVFGGSTIGAGGVVDLESLGSGAGLVLHGSESFAFHGRSVASAGDVNHDGHDDLITTDGFSACVLFGCSVGGCAADLDGSNTTDVFDFAIFASNFGQAVPPGTGGDLDGDGDVDVFDFALFAGDFGCGG